jgi:hypothetical protein
MLMGGWFATQVIQVKEIMMTNSSNSSKALDKGHKYDHGGGGRFSDASEQRKLGRQHASRMWWRNVKLVLVLLLCKKLNPFFSSIFGTVGVLGFYFCSYFIFLVQSGEINTRGY